MGGKCKGVKNCECQGLSVKERFHLYKPLLKAYRDGDSNEQIRILRTAPACFVKLIAETGLNILKGNLKLPQSQYVHLRPHKRLLLSLSKPGISLLKKKSLLLKKKGGFLPALVPVLLSAISGLAGQALAKALE